jgi:probable rRNA maturation factor
MAIEIKNLNKKRKIDLSKLKIPALIASKHVWKNNASINIIFVSNQGIRALNRRYLGEDRSTDVIAFPTSGPERFLCGGNSSKSEFRGDIAISSDKALQNAALYGSSFREELARYVIHGVLHLGGYEDTTPRKRGVMMKKEEELLEKAKKTL